MLPNMRIEVAKNVSKDDSKKKVFAKIKMRDDLPNKKCTPMCRQPTKFDDELAFHKPYSSDTSSYVYLKTVYIHCPVCKCVYVNFVTLQKNKERPVVSKAKKGKTGYDRVSAISGVKLKISEEQYTTETSLRNLSFYSLKEFQTQSRHIFVHVFIPTPSIKNSKDREIPFLINLQVSTRMGRPGDTYGHIRRNQGQSQLPNNFLRTLAQKRAFEETTERRWVQELNKRGIQVPDEVTYNYGRGNANLKEFAKKNLSTQDFNRIEYELKQDFQSFKNRSNGYVGPF